MAEQKTQTPSRYEKLTSLALKRAIFYPDSEIYNAPAGFYDYGSVGSRVKRKWQDYWLNFFSQVLPEGHFTEIDTATVMPEPVFKASGHLEHFQDPVVECSNKKCAHSERADQLLENALKETFEG